MNKPTEDQEEQPHQIRPAHEIAARALALFGAVGIGLHAPRDDVAAWLKETGAWDNLSPRELALIEASSPTRQMMIDASWRSEALTVLLWALGKLSELPPANVPCETAIFQKILPPYADVSAEEFVKTATRRPEAELLEMADACMNLHAEHRYAQQQRRPPAPTSRWRHHSRTAPRN